VARESARRIVLADTHALERPASKSGRFFEPPQLPSSGGPATRFETPSLTRGLGANRSGVCARTSGGEWRTRATAVGP